MLMIDAMEPEAAEATGAELLRDGIAVGRDRQAAVEGGVEAGLLGEGRLPAASPGQSLESRRIMQGGRGDQTLQGGLDVGSDQRWCGEVFPAMHHPVTDQINLLPERLQGRSEPVVEHLIERLIGGDAAPAVPWEGPGGVHQGRLQAGATEIDHQREMGHQRTSQVISTFRGSTFQMLLQYSAMERSEEKKPVRAVFSTDIRFQCIRSVQARLTASWALT